MKKTFALAALLAATAFTPALAQEEPPQGRRMATAEEPTPVRQQVEVQTAQRERGDRGGRVDNGNGEGRRQWDGGNRGNGGWQRQQQAAPVVQAPVAPVPTQQSAPAERQWNRGGAAAQQWQGQQRPDWSARNRDGQQGQPGWSRPAPPVATAPVQPERNSQNRDWQNRDARNRDPQRRDTWRTDNRNSGGVIVDRQGRDGSAWNGQTRNDTWRNDGRNDWRDDRQWDRNGRNDTWRDGRNGRNDGWNNRAYDQRSQWQNQYRDWNRNWSRDWRRDQRYDWQRYRYSNRNLFQGNRYYAPYGWDYGYRRFSIGFSLSYLLYDQQYWIDDPYSYRLPPAYGPYRWVRYYDDVLLVDLRSGQVIDAIYDFFW